MKYKSCSNTIVLLLKNCKRLKYGVHTTFTALSFLALFCFIALCLSNLYFLLAFTFCNWLITLRFYTVTNIFLVQVLWWRTVTTGLVGNIVDTVGFQTDSCSSSVMGVRAVAEDISMFVSEGSC